MNNSKREIRKYIERQRGELVLEDKRIKDDKIFKFLIDSNLFKEAKVIFIYVSFDGEVDTHKIIAYALEQGKQVCVPKILKKSEGIQIMKIDEMSSLTPGYYGILEPSEDSERINIDDVDIIIMPGLAFDRYGGRIGYGGGFYDRLLADSTIQDNRIALAYGFQVFDRIPTDEQDEKVDMIITEDGIFTCKTKSF